MNWMVIMNWTNQCMENLKYQTNVSFIHVLRDKVALLTRKRSKHGAKKLQAKIWTNIYITLIKRWFLMTFDWFLKLGFLVVQILLKILKYMLWSLGSNLLVMDKRLLKIILSLLFTQMERMLESTRKDTARSFKNVIEQILLRVIHWNWQNSCYLVWL